MEQPLQQQQTNYLDCQVVIDAQTWHNIISGHSIPISNNFSNIEDKPLIMSMSNNSLDLILTIKGQPTCKIETHIIDLNTNIHLRKSNRYNGNNSELHVGRINTIKKYVIQGTIRLSIKISDLLISSSKSDLASLIKNGKNGEIENKIEDEKISKLEEQIRNLKLQSTIDVDAMTIEQLLNLSERITKRIKELRECCVCMNNPIKIILIPCGHQCVCKSCSGEINLCPICRILVTSKVEIY